MPHCNKCGQPVEPNTATLIFKHNKDGYYLCDKCFNKTNYKGGKRMTNGDRWRQMTDEQIAEIIAADGCCTCPAIGINSNCGNSELGCKSTIVKWLKQEAK